MRGDNQNSFDAFDVKLLATISQWLEDALVWKVELVNL